MKRPWVDTEERGREWMLVCVLCACWRERVGVCGSSLTDTCQCLLLLCVPSAPDKQHSLLVYLVSTGLRVFHGALRLSSVGSILVASRPHTRRSNTPVHGWLHARPPSTSMLSVIGGTQSGCMAGMHNELFMPRAAPGQDSYTVSR